MRIFIGAGLAALAVAIPASAQTITCNTLGNFTTCNQQPAYQYRPPPPIEPLDIAGALAKRNELILQQQQIEANRRAMERAYAPPPPAPAEPPPTREQALYAAVGHLIVEKDCPGALKTALEGGDLKLAGAVRDYCERK